MIQPWAGWVTAGAALVAALIVVVTARRRLLPRRARGHALAIANVHHANASPVFRRLHRRYGLLLGGEVAALGLVAVSGAWLAMRPITDHDLERNVHNRDVMLCLDVSTSMNELDALVLRQFAELAAGLRGERIGLTIFNGSAITVFPLTDDHPFIQSTLEDAATALAARKRSFVEGTEEGGTSLIGDGLASCAMRFDHSEEHRSRAIVFATDNALAGVPILTLDEATSRVRDRDIRVYAIAASNYITNKNATALAAAAESTGGAFFETDAETTTAGVIAEIEALERQRLDVPPEVIADDRPTVWIIACFAGLGAAVLFGKGLRR